MARPKHADTRYLELKNGKYRVTVPVPRALHAKFGTKLKKPLNTDSTELAPEKRLPRLTMYNQLWRSLDERNRAGALHA